MTGEAIARREAAEWFVVMHDTEDPPAQILQEWLHWLEASEENQRAFENIARTWHDAAPQLLSPPAPQPDDGYDVSMSVAKWRSATAIRPRRQRSRMTRATWWLAAAAGVALCAIALYAFKSTRISKGEFATRTGEHLELLLSDGSRVTLGARSRLAVDFESSLRMLRLEEGEAFFSVVKDPRRPFTVLALDGAITAVGTAFNVRALEDSVTVTVTEGAVKVADAAPIGRGQQLTYRPEKAPQVVAVRRVDPDESARWREGWLVYRHESLRDVIADIARYSESHLQVDASAADLEFTGVVSKDRVSEWIAALPEVSPVKIDAHGATFRITRR